MQLHEQSTYNNFYLPKGISSPTKSSGNMLKTLFVNNSLFFHQTHTWKMQHHLGLFLVSQTHFAHQDNGIVYVVFLPPCSACKRLCSHSYL